MSATAPGVANSARFQRAALHYVADCISDLQQVPLVPSHPTEGGVHWERGINPPRLRAFSLAWRWSIGTRLGIAFAAVAGLAVAANLLIEHEILITRTVVRVPAPASWLPAAIVPRLPSTSMPQNAE